MILFKVFSRNTFYFAELHEEYKKHYKGESDEEHEEQFHLYNILYALTAKNKSHFQHRNYHKLFKCLNTHITSKDMFKLD